MNAPKRWIEEGGSATPLERDLLRSALSLDPPDDAKDRIWTALAAQLPAAGAAAGAAVGAKAALAGKATAAAKAAGGGSAGGALAAGAAGAGILKSVLIGAGSAVALIVTYTAVAPSDPPAAPIVPPVPVTASAPLPPAPPSAVPAPRAEPPPSVSASASSVSEHHAGPHPPSAPEPSVAPESRLREESQALSDARAALRRGDAAGALAQLEQIRARFPGGMLQQEREALAIEALHKSGRRAEAAARARAFLQAYPASPHATRIQGFAD